MPFNITQQYRRIYSFGSLDLYQLNMLLEFTIIVLWDGGG